MEIVLVILVIGGVIAYAIHRSKKRGTGPGSGSRDIHRE